MTTISITIDETARQHVVDKSNAAKQIEWDRAEAAKRAKDPTYAPQPFVPETLQQYVQRIETGLDVSAAALRTRDHLAVIQQQDAESIARLAKAAALPPGPTRDALAAQVDALPA